MFISAVSLCDSEIDCFHFQHNGAPHNIFTPTASAVQFAYIGLYTFIITCIHRYRCNEQHSLLSRGIKVLAPALCVCAADNPTD